MVTFHQWFNDAKRHGVHEPSAMALATVNAQGRPEVRMVLLKEANERGFVFYTHLESPKATALRAHPYAELCFHWNPPGRQVRVRGPVEAVTDEEADAYFDSRPYLSKIGAWSSRQSQPIDTYAELERAVAKNMLLHPRGQVKRPPFWSGFRVVPDAIELWQDRPFRLHERALFTRLKHGWKEQALNP